MSDHFNKLSPSQQERLAILAEECGEVIQIVGKILRHGYESCIPVDPQCVENTALLEKELGDVQWIVEHMKGCGDIDFRVIERRARDKATKVVRYLHHQD